MTFRLPEYPELRFPWFGRMPIEHWRRLRQVVYARDDGCCRYCNTPVELFDAHIHHVLALADGGTNHPTNLKTSCVACHHQRHPFMKSPLERAIRTRDYPQRDLEIP